jgi:uncharacterized membrane protein
MHVIIVHFPIALLLLAGMAEAWRSIRRNKQVSPTAVACLAIGGASAVLSSILGWIHKGFFAPEGGREVALHQWIGIASAVVAVVALLLLIPARKGKLLPYRLATITCAFLVAAGGTFRWRADARGRVPHRAFHLAAAAGFFTS